jgi:HlyD family secretion protein
VAKRSFNVGLDLIGQLDAGRAMVAASQVRSDKAKIIYLIEDGARVNQNDVLVRIDPTPFGEEVAKLENELRERHALVEAHRQDLEYEKSQVHREIKTAEIAVTAAGLDLRSLEFGEGPLELAKLEGSEQEARQELDIKDRYLKELLELRRRALVSDVEIANAEAALEKSLKAHDIAHRQFVSFRDHALPTKLEQARTKVARTEMELTQAKNSGGYKIGRAAAGLKKASEELESTRRRLDAAREDLDRTVIRATMPGMVVHQEGYRDGQQRKPRVGDMALLNAPILYVPDVTRLVVNTFVREIDLHKMIPGRRGSVAVDSYPDLRLEGVVDYVGVLAQSRNGVVGGEKYFQAAIRLSSVDPRLRPGMTARISIATAAIENAVAVPGSAVFEGDGRRFAYVELPRGFERRELRVGWQGDDWSEVVGGLAVGERIALSEPPKRLVMRETALAAAAVR